MTRLVELLAGLVLAGTLVAVFVRWERTGRSHWAPIGLLILVAVESCLYENQDLMPRGLFHPGSGSFQFRLPEVVILLALAGRLLARGAPRSIGPAALAWAAFGAWLVAETAVGVLRHNSTVQIPYEAKAVVYVVGGFALAAGVPAETYVRTRCFARLARAFALPAVLLTGLTLAGKHLALHLPLLSMPDFGLFGADAATVLAAIGFSALVFELGAPQKSPVTLLATVPLILGPLVASQRAALVGVAVTLFVVVVAVLGPTARRRLRVTIPQVALAALAATAVLIAVTLAPAAVSQRAPQVPLRSTISQTFHQTAKVQSANERVAQWDQARHLIAQHALMGWGLGVEYTYYSVGQRQLITTDLTHNILLDLAMRTGAVGVVLFLIALIASVGGGLGTWRRQPDAAVALLALALVAVVLGVVGKGMFESIFEKYRLATMVGLMVGVLRSCVTSPRVPAEVRRETMGEWA